MPPPQVDLDEHTSVNISHEGLMRVWKRLRDWVREESESASQYRRLLDTVRRHEKREGRLQPRQKGAARPDQPKTVVFTDTASLASDYHEPVSRPRRDGSAE